MIVAKHSVSLAAAPMETLFDKDPDLKKAYEQTYGLDMIISDNYKSRNELVTSISLIYRYGYPTFII